jgi:RimJ/RimL family protein N-acetyltransferase
MWFAFAEAAEMAGATGPSATSDLEKLRKAWSSLFSETAEAATSGGGAIGGATSDFDKLRTALGKLRINSIDDVMEKMGLAALPRAQRYGILFGLLTFVCTVTAVITLLFAGGTVTRLKEQADNGGKPIPPDAVKVRARRPLLLERLLMMRDWLLKTNYPEQTQTQESASTKGHQQSQQQYSTLTNMLLNLAPNSISKDEKSNGGSKKKAGSGSSSSGLPDQYQTNYVHAYRRCQDYPGGSLLATYPEGRYECFARAYAGCGTHTSTAYRRSYARMYEAVTCRDEKTFKSYDTLFTERPADIVGRSCRLEVLQTDDRHLPQLYQLTSGEATGTEPSYDPNMVWAFMDYGPFETEQEIGASPLFQSQSQPGKSAFAIIEAVTQRLCGVIVLANDDPANLSVELDFTLVKPSARGTQEEIEACFLLIDKLFALGYRRIVMAVDVADTVQRKLPGKLCFTQEAVLPKHRIVKDSNRDSVIYGLLNSDWTGGARDILFENLHGAAALKCDLFKESQEATLEVQQTKLKEQAQQRDADLVTELEGAGSASKKSKSKKGNKGKEKK